MKVNILKFIFNIFIQFFNAKTETVRKGHT